MLYMVDYLGAGRCPQVQGSTLPVIVNPATNTPLHIRCAALLSLALAEQQNLPASMAMLYLDILSEANRTGVSLNMPC